MSKLSKQVNELLTQFKEGNNEAIDELVNLTYDRLLFVATKYTGNRENAKDAISEAYISLLKNINTFDPTKDGFNWLCKIVENKSKNIYIKENKFVPLEDNKPNERNDFEKIEAKCDIYSLLNTLTPEEREIIDLRFYQDMTFEEISSKLGITITMAYNRLQRVLKKLKRDSNS